MTYSEQLLADEIVRTNKARLALWLERNRDRILAENPHIGVIMDWDSGEERFYRSDQVGETGAIVAFANPLELLDNPATELKRSTYEGFGKFGL